MPDHSHDRSHGHAHGHAHGGSAGGSHDRAFAIGIAVNLAFVGVEAFYGWQVDSLALLADAGHNLSDVAGLVLAWAGAFAGRRAPDARHTYGWKRASILAAFANALLLLVAIGSLSWAAVGRLSSPQPMAAGTVMAVAAVGIVVNLGTALLFLRGRDTDLNIRGAFLHMAADAAVSLGVVVAGALALWQGWVWLDPVASLLIGLVILVGTWGLFRDSLHLMFDGVPSSIDLDAVRAELGALPGVARVDDLHVWAMGTTEVALTAHLVTPGGPPDDAFYRVAAERLKQRFSIGHVTLQAATEAVMPSCGESDPQPLAELAPAHPVTDRAMQYKDYYEALGVGRNATQDEIKGAYRKLARKYHPDVSKMPDAEKRFKELNEANEVLKDPEKRAAYDQMGSQWKAGQEFQPPPNWDAGFEFRGGDAGGFSSPEGVDNSDFFEALFGRRGRAGAGARRSAGMQGGDHHAKVLIDLEDSYRGTERSITLRSPAVGPDGRVTLQERTLDVHIPKGIRSGQHLRLAKQGGAGSGGAAAGDLYLEIEFNPHPRFRLDGADVYVDLPLAPWEAALGATVEAPTPEGAVQLTVPAGSAAGRKLRLKGRGLPGKNPGDLYAVLGIALPPADSGEAREAYAAMARAFEFDPRK